MHKFYLKLRRQSPPLVQLFLVLVISLLLLPHSHAQQAWTLYDTSNSGLPYNNATCVLPDGQGGIWVGTDYRLAHFDGNNTWEIYDTNNSGLPDNAIRSLLLDDDGNLWVGTFLSGLAKYDGTNWTVFNTSNSGLEDSFVRSMVIDNDGIMWIGTSGGLHRYDGTNWQVYNQFNSPLLSSNIPTMAVDANNVLWLGTINGGLARLENGNFTIYDADSSMINDNTILQIHIDDDQNKWLATPAGGLNILDNTGAWFLYVTLNSDICDNSINSVAELNGTFYIGTATAGICTFNFIFWNNYHSGNTPLPGDDVNCIVSDGDSTLWLSVEELGIVKVVPQLFTNNDIPVLPNIKVYPNPVSDFLMIETPASTVVRLYDLNGRLQVQKENLTSNDRLDIQHLPKGIYFLELKIGAQRFVKKIVKI